MSAIEILPSLKQREPFDEARFLRFVETRPHGERWQLIDGNPVQMMNPATKVHNRIAANLERLLNRIFEESRPDLDALREVPLAISGHDRFRPIADLAVIPSDPGADAGGDAYFFGTFYLAAEVLSQSNSPDYVSLKRQRYADCPDCLHVLIVSQTDFSVEVWSRSNDWQGRVYRSEDDRIELPEFGFSCALKDLYRGTPVK